MISKQHQGLTVCQGQSIIIDFSALSPATLHLAQFNYAEFNQALLRFQSLIQRLHNALSSKHLSGLEEPERELKLICELKDKIVQNFRLFQKCVAGSLGERVGDSRIFSLQQRLIFSQKRFYQLEEKYLKAQSHFYRPPPFILNSPAQIVLPQQYTPDFPKQPQTSHTALIVPDFSSEVPPLRSEHQTPQLTPFKQKEDYILVQDRAETCYEELHQAYTPAHPAVSYEDDEFSRQKELEEQKMPVQEKSPIITQPEQEIEQFSFGTKRALDDKSESELRQRYFSELSVSTEMNSFEFLKQNTKEERVLIDSQEMPSEPPSVDSSILENPNPFEVNLSPIQNIKTSMDQIGTMFQLLSINKENHDYHQQPEHRQQISHFNPNQPQGESFSAGADYHSKRERIKLFRQQNKPLGFSCPQASIFTQNNPPFQAIQSVGVYGSINDYSKSSKVSIITNEESQFVRKDEKREEHSPEGTNKRKGELQSKLLNIRSASVRRKMSRRA